MFGKVFGYRGVSHLHCLCSAPFFAHRFTNRISEFSQRKPAPAAEGAISTWVAHTGGFAIYASR